MQDQNEFPIKTNLSDVRDLGFINNKFYLHTVNATFIYDKNGKLLIKLYHNNINKGNYFDNQWNYSISTDGRIYDMSKVLIDISDKLEKENREAKFLSKSENNFFSCLVDTGGHSYSDAIFKITVIRLNLEVGYFSSV